ncbi:MAG: isochorismatase [Gemmatimonadetes bacterium]|nr:isochorismatase [Gemmatimonadota bacterium]|tara:strand:- start:13299 stop:13964 length:666 start_codon:yes stop_codon:yes gene_type:complete
MDMDSIQRAIDSVRSFYEEQGIFMKRFGYGERPAMVIIDMAYGWTDPEYATGSARLDDAVEGIQALLPVARAKHVPIIYTTYPKPRGEEEPMHTSNDAKAQFRVWDAHACEIDHRLTPLPADLIIYKENASAFFNTPLITYLTERKIDTLIITGCSTSACVRATSTDARAYRFKAIVPRECAQDRAAAAHEWNLLDIDAKFGDVVSRDEVVAYLQGLPDPA